jgi:hypothetical protein
MRKPNAMARALKAKILENPYCKITKSNRLGCFFELKEILPVFLVNCFYPILL